MDLIKYSGADLNKPEGRFGTYKQLQEKLGGEFYGVDADKDGGIDYDVFVTAGNDTVFVEAKGGKKSPWQIADGKTKEIILQSIKSPQETTYTTAKALNDEESQKTYIANAKAEKKILRENLVAWAKRNNAQLYLVADGKGGEYAAYKKTNGETKIFRHDKWQDLDPAELQNFDNASPANNSERVTKVFHLNEKAMDSYVRRAPNAEEKTKRQQLVSWAKESGIPLYSAETADGKRTMAYKHDGKFMIVKEGKWQNVNAAEFKMLNQAVVIPKAKGYHAEVLTEEEKEYYSKKFVFDMQFTGQKDFDIVQTFAISRPKLHFDPIKNKDSTIFQGEICAQLESRPNYESMKRDEKLTITISKDEKLKGLTVNGVPIDLEAEPKEVPKVVHKTETQNSFKATKSVLTLSESGPYQYPRTHSVFAVTSQKALARSHGVSKENLEKNIEERKGFEKSHNYGYLGNGSKYIASIANGIKDAKAKDTLYDILGNLSNKNIKHALPIYRMNIDKSTQVQKDFEVLIITGKGFDSKNEDGSSYTAVDDERRFQFDAKMLEHSFTQSKNLKSKETQHLRNPSPQEIEAAIKKRAQSARINGRQLMIVYSGHGSAHYQQYGIDSANSTKEGSGNFQFELSSYFSENEYKILLQRYLSDIETIHVIDACHAGAAVTAVEPHSLPDHTYA